MSEFDDSLPRFQPSRDCSRRELGGGDWVPTWTLGIGQVWQRIYIVVFFSPQAWLMSNDRRHPALYAMLSVELDASKEK